MGNNLQFAQICMMHNHICEEAHINAEQTEVQIKKYITPKSSQQLKQKILKFVDKHQLYLYTKRQKIIFQTLVSINQEKIAQKGLQLLKSKVKDKQNQNKLNLIWENFMSNVQSIKLEDLDGLFEQFKKEQIFQNSKKPSQNRNQHKNKIDKLINDKILKIQQKKQIKKNHQYYYKGNEILYNNELLVIAPVECFSGIGALRNETHLPSGATLLQMFISKIKAVMRRNNCSIGLIFIVNQAYLQIFQQQISKIKGLFKANVFKKLQADQIFPQNSSSQLYFPQLNYYVFPYKSSWPLFNQDYQISFNNRQKSIQFDNYKGDLLKYLENNWQILNIISSYCYLQFSNLNNMLSQIADSSILGYLEAHQELDLAVKVIKPHLRQFQLSSFMKLDPKGFIYICNNQTGNIQFQAQFQLNKEKYVKNSSLVNTEEYFMKTRLILNQPEPLRRLLLSRIKKQKSFLFQKKFSAENIQNKKYCFIRDFSHIFYLITTSLILVEQQNEFSHAKSEIKDFKPQIIKNGHMGYSLYCKKILGIHKHQQNDQQNEQIVDIDAGILHKGSQEIVKIVNKLKSVEQIGFPLILYSYLCNSQQNAK